LDSFVDDNSTRHLYSIMICPCFLPVSMSTSNRIIKPSYESYQPVIAAQQLGLGQVPPHFLLHHLIESSADLPDLITKQKCYISSYLFNQRIQDLVVNVEGSHLSKSFRTDAAAN
jgi:hypothetical protein